jgi:hypothetical protein
MPHEATKFLPMILGSGSDACFGSTFSLGGMDLKDLLLTATQIATLIVIIATLLVALRALKTTQQENNKSAFFALLPQVDKLTESNQFTTFMGQFTAERDSQIETEFKQTDNAELRENTEFLKWFSEKLGDMPVSDRFRRNSLFSALERLRKDADKARKELFRDALCSRIGDEAARFLILQSVRECDDRMLKIFGSFPLAFENLHRMPSLLKELVQRFAKPFANEILAKAESI